MTITVIIYKSDFTITNNVLTPLTIRALNYWFYLYPNSDTDCQEKMVKVTLGKLLRGFDKDDSQILLIPEKIKAICIALLNENAPNHNFVVSQHSYDDTVFGGQEKAESVKNEMEKSAQVNGDTFTVDFIESVYLQTVIDDLKSALEAFLGKRLEHKKLIQRLKQGLAQMPACSDELLSHLADLRQAGRLSEEEDLAIKGHIRPESPPNPNIPSRFEQEPQNNIDKGEKRVIDEHNDQKKMIDNFNLFNLLIIVMVLVLIVWSLVEFNRAHDKEIDKEKEKAESALVEGRYDDAENLASNINEYYSQTMVVAIQEIVATKMEVAIKTIVGPKPVIPPSNPIDEDKLRKLLESLEKNAENAIEKVRLSTPSENSAVWWAAKMLEIEEKNTDAKNILEKVIDKYLEMYHKPDRQPNLKKLSPVINKPVLLGQTQLKDYATDEQREQITQLLGEEYW
ncbi:MAG: hypothetical protein VSS75_034775, partial [Candidatus Parabeggiatoa sp.]|nr:hypothetical protein [Candidatus Parabeggiatoa sp.]